MTCCSKGVGLGEGFLACYGILHSPTSTHNPAHLMVENDRLGLDVGIPRPAPTISCSTALMIPYQARIRDPVLNFPKIQEFQNCLWALGSLQSLL